MDQFKRMLAGIAPFQRATIVLGVILAGAALYGVMHWRKESDFKPLYTNLSTEDTAAVVQKLKESGVEYRLSESGNIVSASSTRVAELRLEMAAAGLPKSGRIGFEIFDKANLGATEFVEHVNYRRALEGELERSLGALAEVENARVHLTFPKDSVFLESREPAKASVMVKLRSGARLPASKVQAIGHLVSSAVAGLSPTAVSVVDVQGNLLSRPAARDQESSEAALDYRQRLERDLVQKINTTLEPLLGRERFRTSVALDCDLTSGEHSEETVDPSQSVMTASQKTEELASSGGASGIPGTASNLPRPSSRPGASSGGATRRTENVTYLTSRTVRRIKQPQGAIKRMSVAVLLDQVRWELKNGAMARVEAPPSADMLKSVRELVTVASGFSEDRGDQMTVESLPFETTRNDPPPAPLAAPASPAPNARNPFANNPQFLIGAAGGAVALLVVAGVVIFMMKRKKKPGALSQGTPGKQIAGSTAPALVAGPAGEHIDPAKQLEAQLAEHAALQQAADAAALAELKLPKITTKKSEVLAKELRETTKKDPGLPALVLQTWIQEG